LIYSLSFGGKGCLPFVALAKKGGEVLTLQSMKKSEIIFGSIRVPLDFLIIFSSFFIARKIRLITDLIPNISLPIQTINTSSLLLYALIGASLFIIVFSIHSMYFIKANNSKIKELLEILRYSFYSFLFLSIIIYLWIGFIFKVEIPRLILWFSFLIWTFWVILERIALNNIQSILTKKGFIQKKKLIIINNKKTNKIKNILNDIKKARIYKIKWYINKKDLNLDNDKIKYLGWIENITKIFENKECDEILYIDSDFNKKELVELWDLSRIFWIKYRYIANSFDITKTNTSLSLINTIPTIEINNTPLDNWAKIMKRLFDILAWIIWIILFFPLMLIIAILIKLEDPEWPIIYKNYRIWTDGKKFKLYKFRYMKWKYCIKESYWLNNSEDKALKYEQELIKKSNSRKWALYKIKNDPRKTKIWTFIEKYSIDELPQFFNIIIWNMSLVWPRPHQEREVEKYSLQQKRLLTIKPWITWMAQVNWRETNDFDNEAKLDLFYIENWSFLLDLKIILKTIVVILASRKK